MKPMGPCLESPLWKKAALGCDLKTSGACHHGKEGVRLKGLYKACWSNSPEAAVRHCWQVRQWTFGFPKRSSKKIWPRTGIQWGSDRSTMRVCWIWQTSSEEGIQSESKGEEPVYYPDKGFWGCLKSFQWQRALCDGRAQWRVPVRVRLLWGTAGILIPRAVIKCYLVPTNRCLTEAFAQDQSWEPWFWQSFSE